MTDLRDRIAAAALNAYEGHENAWAQSEGDIVRRDWLEVADAVIAALGLNEIQPGSNWPRMIGEEAADD